MKASCKRLMWLACKTLIAALVVQWSLPFVSGLYYATCGDRADEQAYLDRCIAHLQKIRAVSTDPNLNGVLDYTIARYSRVGSWDVMVMPLASGLFSSPDDKAIGMNCPWCPGVTLDPCLLTWAPEDTALVLVHEALHDYWPCFGHAHVRDREFKLYVYSFTVKQRRHHVSR